MKKIESPEQLNAVRERAKAEMECRVGDKDMQITVHMGTCGIAAGARDVLTALMDELTIARRSNVMLRQSGCLGLCDREPMLTVVDKDGRRYLYGRLDAKKARLIVKEHVMTGNPVVELLIKK